MPDSLPGKHQQPKKPFLLVRRIFYDERPAVRHFVQFLVEQGKFVKRGWPVFVIIAAGLCWGASWITYRLENKKSETEIRGIINYFSNSNLFLLGQIERQDNQVNEIQKKVEYYKQDTDMQITNQENDFNQRLREKNKEIANLNAEKMTAEQELSLFESSPEKISTLLSNFYNHKPTNLDQLHAMVGQFTNSINSMDSERPKFAVYLNGMRLSDGTICFLPKSREIFLEVKNIGGEAADKLTINFFADLTETNLNANGWTLESRSSAGWNGWETTAQQLIPSGVTFDAATFYISTNLHVPVLTSQILVHSIGSKLQVFNVGLVLIDNS
jgi:hypothetical protein